MRLNYIATVCLFAMALLVSCGSAPEWTPLFNGTDLSGWALVNGSAEYKVEDGAIVGVATPGSPNSFLATDDKYRDFILEYDARTDRDLNSGVQIRSISDPDINNGRVHGYQIELDPSARAWTGGIYDEARRGWLYNLECNPPAKAAYKPEQWNHFRVEAVGSRIRVWLNGVPAADIIDEMTSSGIIALQVHGIGNNTELAGRTAAFRNIRILTHHPEKYQLPDTREIPQVSWLDNRLTQREIDEGWALLWDGKTTEGWRGARLDRFPEQGWTIGNGVLTVQASEGAESANGGDIVTVDQYGNFELEVDFKITEGANSGIKYFVDCDLNKGPGSAIGCEYQILDDENHPDAKLGKDGNRTLGSLYDLITADALRWAPDESTPKRTNGYGWNRAKIVSRDGHVEHYLNGIKIVEYERGTPEWRELVAGSKYRDWPGFGELEKGNILLQDHGNEVSFKNIKIRNLDK